MVFLILIGVVAVAAFLFKSGKLDSLLGKSDEDTNTQEVSEPKKEEEQQPVEEKPAQPIDIKNCDVKETIYILHHKFAKATELVNIFRNFFLNINISCLFQNFSLCSPKSF